MFATLALLCAQTPAAAAPAEDPLAKTLWLGFAIKPYGDWDHDGHADFVVSAPRLWDGVQSSVALVSGADGRVLLEMHGELWFGISVEVLGRVEGERLPDIAVAGGVNSDGFGVRVYSGKDGTLHYGMQVGTAGTIPDVNSDGIVDLVTLAARTEENGKFRTTALEFRSGADGKPVRTVTERNPSPFAALGIADCNGDGCSDIVALFKATPDPMAPRADFELISGADGATLARRSFEVQCTQPSITMVDAGEPGPDGKPQVIVSLFYNKGSTWLDHRSAPLPSGKVSVLSTPSLETRFVLEAKDAVTCNGYSLAGGFDVNGDKHRDFLVSEYPDRLDKLGKPRVRVYSGADGALIRSQDGGRNFGRTVNWVGDIDADGTPDYAVSSLYDRDTVDIDFDHVDVFSGKTGACILQLPKPAPPPAPKVDKR